jgi:hypothetical protein
MVRWIVRGRDEMSEYNFGKYFGDTHIEVSSIQDLDTELMEVFWSLDGPHVGAAMMA